MSLLAPIQWWRDRNFTREHAVIRDSDARFTIPTMTLCGRRFSRAWDPKPFTSTEFGCAQCRASVKKWLAKMATPRYSARPRARIASPIQPNSNAPNGWNAKLAKTKQMQATT